MSEEEQGTDITKNLKKDLREYVEKRAELFRLIILEEISQVVAQGVQRARGPPLLPEAPERGPNDTARPDRRSPVRAEQQGPQRVVGILLLAGAVLFAWFAFSFLLSEWLNSMSAGFAISSLPLFLTAILFMNTKSKKMTERIQASIIDRVLSSIERSSDNNQEKEAGDE